MNITAFTYFFPEAPKLAHIDQPLFERLSLDRQWIAEPKFNGARLELHRPPGGAFQFWDRHGGQLKYVPSDDLLAALKGLNLNLPPGYVLLDGELRHNKVPGVSHRIVLYDAIVWDGKVLLDKPFWFRRGLLETITSVGFEPVGLACQFQDDFRQVFDRITVDPEIEGLVMKNLSGKLSLGRRSAVDSSWMIKIRRQSGRYRF